ncbi:hypothetical protein HDV01_007882 [Terramyces sp. JEL0728]|nr:hypothetical protein HDV01_007882 [Terramyces sp. JEL0728]
MNQNHTSQPLPPGYIAQWDQNYQRYYYVNTKTGISSWDDPRAPQSYQPTLQTNTPPPYTPTIQNPQYRPANPYGYPAGSQQYPQQPPPPQNGAMNGLATGAAAGAAGLALEIIITMEMALVQFLVHITISIMAITTTTIMAIMTQASEIAMNPNLVLPGFMPIWDPLHQQHYFVNTNTGVSTWDDPRHPHPVSPITFEDGLPSSPSSGYHPALSYTQPTGAEPYIPGSTAKSLCDGAIQFTGCNRYHHYGPFQQFHHHHHGHLRF